MARYTPDGSLDPSFGTGGKVVLPVGLSDGGTINALALQDNGKILAAGRVDDDPALGRFNPNGSLDTTFNAAGSVPGFAIGAELDPMATLGGTLYGVAAAPSGKIVVAGSIDMATDRDTFVARRTTTGAANGSASIAI